MPITGSLYVHVPFCTKKCGYCHFFVVKDGDHSSYIQSIIKQWQSWKDRFNPFLTIYFGGGTPSLLSPEELGTLLKLFPVAEGAEITIEANPETTDLAKLKAFRALGINRISIGVQSFDDKLLKTLTRTHDAKKAIETVYNAQEAGFDNISIDLMYDLPGQTLESWKHTLKVANSLPITHLSLYNLTIEPGTAFFRKKLDLPEEGLSLQLLEEAVQTIRLPRYEISAFGRPSLHNIGYWTNRPFLGLGPSAFSFIDGRRFSDRFTEQLPPEKAEREAFALHLRLLEGAPIPDFSVESLLERGLIEKKGNRMALTKRGLLLYDYVASEIV